MLKVEWLVLKRLKTKEKRITKDKEGCPKKGANLDQRKGDYTK